MVDWEQRFEAQSPARNRCLAFALGLQWMFDGSEEARDLRGLGVFTGPMHAIFGSGEVAARGLESHRD